MEKTGCKPRERQDCERTCSQYNFERLFLVGRHGSVAGSASEFVQRSVGLRSIYAELEVLEGRKVACLWCSCGI